MTTRRHDHDHTVVTSVRCHLRGETTPTTDYVKPEPHSRTDQTTRAAGGRSCMQDAGFRPGTRSDRPDGTPSWASFQPLRT